MFWGWRRLFFKRRSGNVVIKFWVNWIPDGCRDEDFEELKDKFCQLIDNVKNSPDNVQDGPNQPDPHRPEFEPLDLSNPPQGK